MAKDFRLPRTVLPYFASTRSSPSVNCRISKLLGVSKCISLMSVTVPHKDNRKSDKRYTGSGTWIKFEICVADLRSATPDRPKCLRISVPDLWVAKTSSWVVPNSAQVKFRNAFFAFRKTSETLPVTRWVWRI